MRTRVHLLALASVIAMAGTAHAQPGTAFLEGSGGAMLPVGTFRQAQNPGWAYSVLAGYELIDFVDLTLEFTHSFNDNDNVHFSVPGVRGESDEVHQTFVVDAGPRINFLPADSLVRPYGIFQVGWYHFANFNSVRVDGVRLVSDEDDDAVGIEAGLGLEGTVFQLFERPSDAVPMLDVALGVHGSYHQAFFPNRPDNQFVTTMGSLTVRF